MSPADWLQKSFDDASRHPMISTWLDEAVPGVRSPCYAQGCMRGAAVSVESRNSIVEEEHRQNKSPSPGLPLPASSDGSPSHHGRRQPLGGNPSAPLTCTPRVASLTPSSSALCSTDPLAWNAFSLVSAPQSSSQMSLPLRSLHFKQRGQASSPSPSPGLPQQHPEPWAAQVGGDCFSEEGLGHGEGG